MKNWIVVGSLCLVVGLFSGVFIVNHNTSTHLRNDIVSKQPVSLCVLHKGSSLAIVQGFIQEQLPEKYILNITDMTASFELSESPSVLGTKLYDEMKDSAICKSELMVSVKNKETEKELKLKLNTRYQIVQAVFPENDIYTKMAKIDLKNTVDSLIEQINVQEVYSNLIKPTEKKVTNNTNTKKVKATLQNWSKISPEQKKKIINTFVSDDKNLEAISICVSETSKILTPEVLNVYNEKLKEVILECDKNVKKEQNRLSEDTAKTEDPYVDAKFMVNKFKQNIVAFNKEFANQTLQIRGKIDAIGTVGSKAYVMLLSSFGGIQCMAKDSDQLLDLQEGQEIKVHGLYKADSYININILLEDCVVVK